MRFAPAAARRACPSATEPVNAMRSTPGWATSAAPASSPIPCTTLNAPSGSPASLRDVGEHRGGERRPLRRLQHHGVAGRERRRDPPRREHQRRVPRRDDGGDAGRIPGDALVEPVRSPRPTRRSASAAGRRRTGSCARRAASRSSRIERRSEPLSRGLDRGELGDARLDAVGDRGAGPRRAPSAASRPRRRSPSRAASTAASASAAPPRATSAIGCSSIGETSANVRRRRDALAADPVVGRDLDALDHRPAGRQLVLPCSARSFGANGMAAPGACQTLPGRRAGRGSIRP